MDAQASFEAKMESDCNALDTLFQQIISDMKGSFQVWEDFTSKATKLSSSLRTTLLASSAFLEAFQKVADMAVGSRGTSSEIGSALIRLCLRQRGIEEKFKAFAGSIIESMVCPIQERMEEWKKAVTFLDKEHNKESKKCHQEIKKAHAETVRLRKKTKKGKPETMKQLEGALREYNERYMALQNFQRQAVRSALIEERSRYCMFVRCVRPIMDHEVATLSEVIHVQEILESLQRLTVDPLNLPPSSERLIYDPSHISESTKEFLTVSKSSAMKSSVSVTSASRSLGRESGGSRKSSLSSSSSQGCQGPGGSPSHQHVTSCFGGRNLADDDDCYEKENAKFSPINLTSPWPDSSQNLGTAVDPDPRWTDQDRGASDSPVDSDAYEQLNPNLGKCSVTSPVNPYAIPNVGEGEQIACNKGNEAIQDPIKTAAIIKDVKGSMVPLEGYVNMNQLACMACLDLNLKDPLSTDMKKPNTAGSPSAPTSPLLAHHMVATKQSGNKDASPTKILTVEEVIAAAVKGGMTLKKGQSRDRSLPPLSRHSTGRKNSLPGNIVHSVVVPKTTNPSCAVHGKRPPTGLISTPSQDEGALPPPPPQLTPQVSLVQDDDDDLPLPPPPEELCESKGGVCRENSRSGGRGAPAVRSKSVAPGTAHAGIIEHLANRFYSRQASVAAVEGCGEQKVVTKAKLQRCQSVEQPDSPAVTCCSPPQQIGGLKSPAMIKSPDTTKFSGFQQQSPQGHQQGLNQKEEGNGDEDDGNSFTEAIQRGVKLRRTITSDRSAPRFNSSQH